MIVCNFCGEEIREDERLQIRAVVDNLQMERQPNLKGDLHPECLPAWYQSALAIKGDRPAKS